MESFFALLQRNVLDRRRWDSRGDLRIAIVTWIERTYHRRRRQTALGRLTPIDPDPTGHPDRLTQPVTTSHGSPPSVETLMRVGAEHNTRMVYGRHAAVCALMNATMRPTRRGSESNSATPWLPPG